MLRRICLFLVVVFASCAPQTDGAIDAERLLNADAEPDQWMALGRTYHGQRFSPLTQINAENVATLGFAWEYEARSRRGRVEHPQQATPLMVDGVLYVSGPWGSAFAVDARTGEERWRYDPDVDGSSNRRSCCGAVSRGLQVWNGKVYVATLDGFLVALDASTGTELWRVDTFIDRDTRFYAITSPPQVAKNVVVIGNSGAEFGVRGYITAYDLETGEERWRFYTVPGDPAVAPPENAAMELALQTWGPDTNWEAGLGGTVWGEMNYDPELDLLYVGTGNSTPYSGWNRDPSGGDNLFLVSILAIDPDDGSLAWHFQQVPWEIWDYTATANMILADLEIDGRPRKVIMQAPKNGFYYVLDRETGEFVSGEAFAFVNWATGLDETGRPIVNPAAVYEDDPVVVFPTFAGAHNWHPMAFNPMTGLTYIPIRENGMVIGDEEAYEWKPGHWNVGTVSVFDWEMTEILPAETQELFAETVAEHPDLPSTNVGEFLIAWDPIAQRERWRVRNGSVWTSGGGVLTTAGNLVIQGTVGGKLVVYAADTGEPLHEIELGTGVVAAPISYALDGEQYVAVFAGAYTFSNEEAARREYENYGRILAFKLGGDPTPLPPVRTPHETPEPPAGFVVVDSVAQEGETLFFTWCFTCHTGRGERYLSGLPDLHRMSPETHGIFKAVVLDGALSDAGMASFSDVLTNEDVDAIQAYLVREQHELRREEEELRQERQDGGD
jgi:quinohemoprotein ethanol dehydrogenase